jgi:hypothetical protein
VTDKVVEGSSVGGCSDELDTASAVDGTSGCLAKQGKRNSKQRSR